MVLVPLPAGVVPIAAAMDANQVPSDPDVASVAPLVVSADPDEAGPLARMLLDGRRWRLPRSMRRNLTPLGMGHRG